MNEGLFCYGTLQSAAIFEAITGIVPSGEAARLQGYACYRVKRAVYPGILKDPRSSVSGTLYRGLNRSALSKLDQFEGAMYDRLKLSVISDGGQSNAAWVYVIKHDCRHLLTRDSWRYEEYESLFLERFFDDKGSQL